MKSLKFTSIITVIMLFTWSGCDAQESFDWLEYPFDVHFAEIENGETIAYVDEGSGDQTIVMVHGLGSYLPGWKNSIEELKESYRVIALDLPGYGKSAKTAENYSIPFFAESIVQLLEALPIDNVVLAGHSMGAQISIYTALNYPDKVNSLILSAPAGFETFSEEAEQAFRMTVSKETIMATDEEMIRFNLRSNFHEFPESAAFMIEDRLAMMDDPDFEEYARAQAESVFAMLETPVFDQLSEISQPVLVIFGKQDQLIPNRMLHPHLTTEDVAESGVNLIEDAELVWIDDAGHFAHFEKPGPFNKAVKEFLNNRR